MEDLVTWPVNLFLERHAGWTPNVASPMWIRLQSKLADLLASETCLTESCNASETFHERDRSPRRDRERDRGGAGGPTGGGGGGGGGIARHGRRGAERPRIGGREFTREEFLQKDIQSTLNKLSPTNADYLITHLRQNVHPTFVNTCMQMLWSMMVKQSDYNALQFRVVDALWPAAPGEWSMALNDRYAALAKERPWLAARAPVPAIEDYDAYCAYNKWKKQTCSVLQTCSEWHARNYLTADTLAENHVMDDVVRGMDDWVNIPLVECTLDFLLAWRRAGGPWEGWDACYNDLQKRLTDATLPYLLRFKIESATGAGPTVQAAILPPPDAPPPARSTTAAQWGGVGGNSTHARKNVYRVCRTPHRENERARKRF